MTEHHTILGGKVHVYKRPNSSLWQCSSFFAGRNRRTSTKEDSLSRAKEIAEDWYLRLRGKLRDGEIKSEKTFREVSEHYQVNSRGVPPASAMPALAASTWKSWVMLQGVCSPFMLTTPIIGLLSASSSSPIARMKARWGARSSPSVVTRDRHFFMETNLSPGRPGARQDDT